MDCWQNASEFTHVIGSMPYTDCPLVGNHLKGAPILFEGVDCRRVGWAWLHECSQYGQLEAIMEVVPGNWEQQGEDLLFFPCFKIAEDPIPKKQDKNDEMINMLKTDPCGLLLHLWSCSLELGKPGAKTSRSGFGRSYSYGKGDAKLLSQHIQQAKVACRKCDPCNPCLKMLGNGRRCIPVKARG